jgi:hypothetical protein
MGIFKESPVLTGERMRFRTAASLMLGLGVLLSNQVIAAAQSTAQQSGTMLKSSVKDDEQMHQSVKVLVAPPTSNIPSAMKRATIKRVYNGAPLPPPPVKLETKAAAAGTGTIEEKLNGIFRPAKPTPPPKWDYTMTPKNGVMSWAPGYSTAEIPKPPAIRRMQTSLQFSNTRMRATMPQLQATMSPIQVHSPDEMKATQLALPKPKSEPPAGNWEEWYERVAKAMYAQWKQNSVGPGSATVLITAYNTHDVDCRITGFNAADDVKRDAQSEENFKKAALNAVSSLSGDDVWAFPPFLKTPKKVSFDMEFKHAVGEKNGCQIVHTHIHPQTGEQTPDSAKATQ